MSIINLWYELEENRKFINPGPAIMTSEKSFKFFCIIFFKFSANKAGCCFDFLAKTKAILVDKSKLNSCGGVYTVVPEKLISGSIFKLLLFLTIKSCIFFKYISKIFILKN